jgi:radical SAM protein (TIGR01212 family)
MGFPDHLSENWGGKRYNSFNHVLKKRFGVKVHKVSLRTSFTCPNRDGRVAVGGCIYCNNDGHTPANYRAGTSVHEQMGRGIEKISERHGAQQFIAYFQSYTNTYDTTSRLERLYAEALDFPEVVGLSIATRPDCLPNDVLNLIADIARTRYVWLEIGLESMQEKTLKWTNRGHGLYEFLDALERSKARGLQVCVHLILGFQTDEEEDCLQTPARLSALGVDGVKLHNLHVIRHTVLEHLYHQGEIQLLSRDAYVGYVTRFLELLAPNVVIHRLTGQTSRELTVAPGWSTDKFRTLNQIEETLKENDLWQSRLYCSTEHGAQLTGAIS